MMKESLASRLKGYSFKAAGIDFVLKGTCRENTSAADEAFFITNHETALVKVVDLTGELSLCKFRNEKYMLETLVGCKSVPECAYRDEIEYKKTQYGVFVFVRIRPQPSLREELPYFVSESEMLQPVKDILMLLDAMHNRSLAFLNIQPDNFVRSASGGYVALNFDRTITKEYTLAEARENYLLWASNQSTSKYVPPQLLNGKSLIGSASDMFNLGCLAYELCYKQYPFPSSSAAINYQYKIPEKRGVAFPILNEIIQRCLVQGPRRPKAFELLRWLNLRQQQIGDIRELQPLPTTNTINQFTTTIFDQFKNAITKITKESEAWIMSYTEDSDDPPQERFCTMLLVKVYRNKDKLNKIYQLMLKHTQVRISQPVSMVKMMMLCWNFLRKGPLEVASNNYSSSLKEIVELVQRRYENGGDWLVGELCRLNKVKLEQLMLNAEIFEGNFHLIRLNLITKVGLNILENLLLYMAALIGSYEKIQQYVFRSNQICQFVLTNICDEIYDLAATLIILYVSLNKDVELGMRKEPQNRLSYVELALQKTLRSIAKFQKVPKLHPITSLQGGVMTYKYAIDFEATAGVSMSVFELFYHTGRVYNNLILPLPFSETHHASMKQDFNSQSGIRDTRSVSSSTFLEEDSDGQNPTGSNTRQSSEVKQRKTSEDSSNIHFDNWPPARPTATTQGKEFDAFAGFKQKTQNTPTKQSPAQDFEVLWSTRQPEKKNLNFDFFQMNSDSSGQNNASLAKKQSEARPLPVAVPPKGANVPQQSKSKIVGSPLLPQQLLQPKVSTGSSISSKPAVEARQSQKQSSQLMNNIDLLLFDNQHQPSKIEKTSSKQQPPKPSHLFEFDFAFSPKPPLISHPSASLVAQPDKGSLKNIPVNRNSSPVVPGNSIFGVNFAKQSSEHANQSLTEEMQSKTSSPAGRLNLQFIGAPKKDSLFDISVTPGTAKKSVALLQLESEICEDMKDPELRDLIKSSNIVIEPQRVELLKVIGSGSTGQVYKGRYNDQIVAVKKLKIKSHNVNTFKEFERELTTLIRIKKHPNLVSLIAISKKFEEYFLVIDYCEGGNLFELLHRRTDIEISWSTRITIAKQIAVAMNFLHSACKPLIIHRDLKSLNILIENKYQPKSDNINIKVTDFGLSRNPDADYMTSALGTLHWMAPELLENRNYTLKVDIYSYAIVLWEICSRETPYKEFKSPIAIMKHVTVENGRPNLSKINPGCPIELRKLMTRCWGAEQQRPSFSEIISVLESIQLLQ